MEKRIEEIIQKRQSLAQKVSPVRHHLAKLQDELSELKNHCYALSDRAELMASGKKTVEQSLERLDGAITHNTSTLEKLMQRLSRPTLNIGVIGLMGQGKSTFLKSISGLSDNEIPALEGGACTAVRSKIYHHNEETKAIVTFHSEQSFLEEVIVPYYEKLSLGTPPLDLQAFAHSLLPVPPEGATLETMYGHLKDDYHQNFDRYRTHLQAGEPRRVEIKKDEIPNYVIQQRDTSNQLVSFDHLAVKDVEIYCPFEHVEVSKLGLVDVPGLGDTRLGDEDLILETLGQEVDSVLFLRRPDPRRFQWKKADTVLYDLAAEALPNLEDRAFMVLNQTSDGENKVACEALKESLGRMRVVNQPLIADCSDAQAANQVLRSVLEYLDGHILELEERYALVCQDGLRLLHQLMADTLMQAGRVLKAESAELRQFDQRFRQLYDSLTSGLSDLSKELAGKRSEDDSDFKQVVQKALSACKHYEVPTEDEIEQRQIGYESKEVLINTYNLYAVELRIQLSKHFLTLDEGLKQAANQLKEQIVEVLKTQGQLAGLSTAEGREYLAELSDMLAEQDNELAFGFRVLADFDISYGALILSTIRENLMQMIDPDAVARRDETVGAIAQVAATISVEAMKANGTGAPAAAIASQVAKHSEKQIEASLQNLLELDPAAVQMRLKALHERALTKCQKLLEHWVKAPNQIRYYMVREFVDLILYDVNMKENWRAFLREPEIRTKVWTEFRELESMKQSQDAWLAAVQRVKQMNQRQLLEFL